MSHRPAPPSPGGPPPVPAPWHTLEAPACLARLETDRNGLSQAEAERRLQQWGPNRLPPPRRRGPLARFLLQFHNVLIYVLLAAAGVSLALGHGVDAAVILGVVVINAIIGFIQEGKAERALEAIRQLLSSTALVVRDGQRREIDAGSLVPGDLVWLQSGDKVPADLRLLEVKNLRVEEAALTGESAPVDKATDPVESGAALGDRRGMAYSGTLVVFGQARGVVVATGSGTELGRINRLLAEVEGLTTPLLRQFARFGRVLTGAILAASAAVFGYGAWLGAWPLGELFMAVVGLAVAAIPEGLPAIMTITLAIGVQRMARRHAIIRRLPAVEALGSVTVICTDKTGTLTRNEMTAVSLVTAAASYRVSGAGYGPRGDFLDAAGQPLAQWPPDLLELLRAGLLCNDARLVREGDDWRVIGDPTEGALIAAARKAGLNPEQEAEARPRVDVIPFESEHRFMATLHHDHASHAFIYLKGAPEQVLERCHAARQAGEDRPLDPRHWHAALEAAAGQGQRLLAVACLPVPDGRRELSFADVSGGFTLLGLVGLADPPRDEAIAAVARCRAAGIQVKMITGDHAATARAIAGQLGLGGGAPRVLTGRELDALDDAALADAADRTQVFARVSPEHKLRLVRALQARGEVTAMTGDGVNDAPALKQADVGVAMGRAGTEAAREAAQMVLADDNFASIVHAVEEGRTVYDNLKKAILFILPTNVGEAAVIVAAIVLGLAMPITAPQILWVNMVTAVTLALALAFEPAEADVMRRPPRDSREPLLSRHLVWRILLVSTLLVAACLGLFLWESGRGGSLEAARTLAVNMLVLGEVVYLFNTRRFSAAPLPGGSQPGNPYAWLAVAVLLPLQLAFTYWPPMQALFGTTGLGPADWGLLLVLSLAIFGVVEGEKALLARWKRH